VVERFTALHPGLRVAGYRNGYFGAQESEQVAEKIKESGADLLFVAMGSPRQEYWISSIVRRTGVRFALGVGGSFDHLSGLARRAPAWMQGAGLEWFYRLMREPRRLWRRYLVGNSVFVWLVLKQLVGLSRRAG
jgi:N-acetylglucosaminyldiphosphoundecaprenol N-acetyl-beta-D-mannosaminyltransferase